MTEEYAQANFVVGTNLPPGSEFTIADFITSLQQALSYAQTASMTDTLKISNAKTQLSNVYAMVPYLIIDPTSIPLS